MHFHRVALFVMALIPAFAMSQQVRDNLDVLQGPSPTLRYGFYTELFGRVEMGRHVHTLRDIKNNDTISDGELKQLLLEAREELLQGMDSLWK